VPRLSRLDYCNAVSSLSASGADMLPSSPTTTRLVLDLWPHEWIPIWQRHGVVVCKRNRVDIFCHLITMHERDRHTDKQTTERWHRHQRCRIKIRHSYPSRRNSPIPHTVGKNRAMAVPGHMRLNESLVSNWILVAVATDRLSGRKFVRQHTAHSKPAAARCEDVASSDDHDDCLSL